MKLVRTIILLMFLLLPSCKENEIKVMSYNVRFGTAEDGENAWENRKEAAVAMILDQRPAVFGVQEALDFQLEYFLNNCSAYRCVGVGREDGQSEGEHMSVFYDSDRIVLKDWGTYWLSETPDVPSMGWDAWYMRTATWTLLYDKVAKRHFYFVDTHLDNRGVEARKNGLHLIVERIASMNSEKYPMVLCGDFNMRPDNESLNSLREVMKDAWQTAEESDYGTTFHGYGKKEDNTPPIDYIFYQGFKKCKSIARVKQGYGGKSYVSDHYPITSSLEY